MRFASSHIPCFGRAGLSPGVRADVRACLFHKRGDDVLCGNCACLLTNRYANKLAKIAGVDVHELAMGMFEAKADISHLSPLEIVNMDSKVVEQSACVDRWQPALRGR